MKHKVPNGVSSSNGEKPHGQKPVLTEPPMMADEVALQELQRAFRRGYPEGKYTFDSNAMFDWGLDALKNNKFAPSALETFTKLLHHFEGEADFCFRAQRVINTVLLNGSAQRYLLDLSGLKSRINSLGHLNSRQLAIMGDVGDTLGFEMRGGVIVLDGNAGRAVGAKMRGGEIHLNCDFESIGEGYAGRIFHKGALIWEKKG